MLELLVHLDYKNVVDDYSFIEAEIPDMAIEILEDVEKLDANWQRVPSPGSLASYGSQWILEKRSLALQVPSGLLQWEHNVVVNPAHPDFKKLKIIRIKSLSIDHRLIAFQVSRSDDNRELTSN